MGEMTRELIDNWGEGVVTSPKGDMAPTGAYIKGKNCALDFILGGRAIVRKRDGILTLNATAITGSSAVVGIYEFKRRSGASFTSSVLVVSDSGRFDKIDPDQGTLTNIGASTFTSSSTLANLPSFATGNNLCFIVNGTDAKKYDGTTVYGIGITAPSSAPTLADSGTAGVPDGTYEAYVTYYNSSTGQESSAGTTSSTLTLTTNKIDFSAIPVSAEAQVDTRRIYLRNTGTMSNFYLAVTISDNVTTTSSAYNGADSALVDIGPDTEENNPPVSGVKFAVYHKSRLFLADNTKFYYSKIDMTESFDPDAYEEPNPSDGQAITGIFSIFDLLIIFKTNSTYVLVGDDPDTWAIRPIENTIGCVTARSVILTEGRLFWYSEQGPVMWSGGVDKPTLLAPPLISETLDPTLISRDNTYLSKVAAARDVVAARILWSVPQFNQTRNTVILPFNTDVNRWESDGWDPMDVASMATVDNSAGQPLVIYGNYAGQLFSLTGVSNDGVRAGTTVTGTFVASGTTVTTVTDLAATFDTTGAGLVERKVTITDSTGALVDETIVRPRISSNTATSFTMNTAVSGLTDAATYTYHIGGPAMDLQTRWLVHGDSFTKKRYRHLLTQLEVLSGATSDILLSVYVSYDQTSLSLTVDSTITAALWDDALWDVALWGGASSIQRRVRIGRTGTAVLVRYRHYAANAAISVLKVGVTTETLSEMLN